MPAVSSPTKTEKLLVVPSEASQEQLNTNQNQISEAFPSLNLTAHMAKDSPVVKNQSRDSNSGGDEGNDDETNREEDDDNGEDDEDDVDDDQSTEEDSTDSEESEDFEEEEPQLKTARLTANLGPVYRNGDATSAFLVGSDKMIVGTHNGNIHVLQLPTFQSVRVYHAHSASVTAISVSPFPPPILANPELGNFTSVVPSTLIEPIRRANSIASTQTTTAASRSATSRNSAPIPNIPSNNIYIATSSTDGNVCIQSLIDPKDVQLRNFARPVQTVALSPDYKNDRTYLSGGLAGNLIVTVGGSPGRSTSTTIGTAAATASGWLGSIGLGAGSGRDTILHSGEGPVSTIKWSLSGKYVAWLNEFGIKIMRSRLHMDAADAPDDAWKRIGHIDRPQTEEWETMASVWKGRAEWIDEKSIEMETATLNSLNKVSTASATNTSTSRSKTIERLVVGWGGTIWIIHVHPGTIGIGKHVGEHIPGSAEIANVLRMDCIISGFSFFSANLLLVLAFCHPEDDDEESDNASSGSDESTKDRPRSASEPSGGIRRRQNNRPPELRLIDLESQVEVDKVGLILSRYERLSCNDYCLGVLPAVEEPIGNASKGALETIAGLGTDMWNAATNPMALFSSAASVVTRDSDDAVSRVSSATNGYSGTVAVGTTSRPNTVHPSMAKPGMKIFIHSPYDCILAIKRDLGDRLEWFLDQKEYQQAWELLDINPEILNIPLDQASTTGVSDDDHALDSNSSTTATATATGSAKSLYSPAEKEKRRIGELWIRSIVEAGCWREAGEVCERVLTSGDRWEKWVWTFAGAHKFDEIVNHIPSSPMTPPIPPTCYEVILGHYIKTDKPRMRDLLLQWPTGLFDINAITTTLDNQLKFRDVREDSIEAGEVGRDWRIVVECLARLHEANGRTREALKYHIRLHDADAAFRLIRQGHLADVVAGDIPSFIGLRVEPGITEEKDLEEATAEAITLLVDEAHHGLVKPNVVVNQLMTKDLRLYTFFYLRGLWTGAGVCDTDANENATPHANGTVDRLVMESKSLVDEFPDLAVSLFAAYDRELLLAFLRTSTSYAFEAAVKECEKRNFDDELVFLYSKTGEMKKALFLIIDRLHDVSKAISFAKEQDDPDLWEDLLNYSMDKPRFIRGLLEQVGTALDPIRLVKRIPEGLEIDGLREGLGHMLREHEIMCSISKGVARVLRSEVSGAQKDLRVGQRRGVKFNTAASYSSMTEKSTDLLSVNPLVATKKHDIFGDEVEDDHLEDTGDHARLSAQVRPGHCAKCHNAFTEFEEETLVGFACGHIFHTSHLLEITQPGRRVDRDLVNGMGDTTSGGYLIGSKVTHARLLRGRIRGGCPVCR
ncbi:hypothetical protein BROUX41_002522 [Berkeleyomyces rouxiae]